MCALAFFRLNLVESYTLPLLEVHNMQSNIEVRLAVPSDTDALFHLNEVFNGSGESTFDRVRQCLSAPGGETVVIAFVNQNPAGFLCGQFLRSMCYTADYVEMTELFVLEEYRRLGVASRLMAFLENYYQQRGIYAFQLFTGAKNTEAQTLYRKLGYQQTEELFMRKRITPSIPPARTDDLL